MIEIRRRTLILAGAFALAGEPARAFWENCTHPELASNSARLLDSAGEGRYREFVRVDFLARLRAGATDEDMPASRVVNHFYHVPDGRALNIPGLANVLVNAPECLPGSGGTICANEDAVTRATRFRAKAADLYRANDKIGAYHFLGRAMHLLADLHQPAHVYNDAHLPNKDHDASALEGFVETKRCPARIPAGAIVPTYPADDPSRVLTSGAAETYGRAQFFGMGRGPGSAAVLDNRLDLIEEARISGGDACHAAPHWILVDPITRKELCYNDGLKQEGKYIDGFYNAWWELHATPEPRRLNPENGYSFYIDRYDEVATGRTTTAGGAELLVEHFADTQLLPAVERGAAYLELFAREVDSLAPRFSSLRVGGASPRNFSDRDAIETGESIEVVVEDPANARFPVPSGLHRLEIVNLASGAPILPDAPLPPSDFRGTITRIFPPLPAGSYELRAIDGLGNMTPVHIRSVLV